MFLKNCNNNGKTPTIKLTVIELYDQHNLQYDVNYIWNISREDKKTKILTTVRDWLQF